MSGSGIYCIETTHWERSGSPQPSVRHLLRLIESIDGPERGGSFTVRAGERFPLFIVTAIDARGVTIAANGKPYFYPVGGRALGTQPATPAPTTRPLTPAPR